MAATNKEEQQCLKLLIFNDMLKLHGMVWRSSFHSSWVIIHNIKPNYVDYYHIEGFWDCSMYVRNKYGVKIHTWVETPCMNYTCSFNSLRPD